MTKEPHVLRTNCFRALRARKKARKIPRQLRATRKTEKTPTQGLAPRSEPPRQGFRALERPVLEARQELHEEVAAPRALEIRALDPQLYRQDSYTTDARKITPDGVSLFRIAKLGSSQLPQGLDDPEYTTGSRALSSLHFADRLVTWSLRLASLTPGNLLSYLLLAYWGVQKFRRRERHQTTQSKLEPTGYRTTVRSFLFGELGKTTRTSKHCSRDGTLCKILATTACLTACTVYQYRLSWGYW